MKMSQIVGKKLDQFRVQSDQARPSDTAVGIEIEVENIQEDAHGLLLWDQVIDGSIVRGVEFVSKPIWGTAITDALDEIRKLFIKHDPYMSFRTSIHVHVNVLDMSPEQLEHFVLLYVMYELPLFRLHQDWGRYDNIFCVPVRKSMKVQDGYAQLLDDLSRRRIRDDYVGYKYSAFNPNALARFGTMEFRHMGGTTDMDKVDEWINILLQLKLAADEKIHLDNSNKVFGKYRSLMDVRQQDLTDGMELIDYIQMKRGI